MEQEVVEVEDARMSGVRCEEGKGVDMMAAEHAGRMVLKQEEGTKDNEADERSLYVLDEAEEVRRRVSMMTVLGDEVAEGKYKCPVVLEEVLVDLEVDRRMKVEDKG